MSHLTIENVYTRQKAKALTKKHFWKLLGMMIVILSIIYAITFGSAFLAVFPAESGSVSPLSMVCFIVVILAVSLLASGLSLGLTAAMLYICRDGEQPKVGQVFSRMGSCLKGIGLGLWVGLKTLVWALPVYVPLFFVTGAILVAGDPHTMQPTESTQLLLMLLPLIALITVFALVIPAIFRYMLSTYILADKPATGVFECVRQSKAMMKGHKWQAFKLVIPMFLLLFLFEMILVIVLGVVSVLANSETVAVILSLIGVIAYIAFALIYTFRIALAYCIFYLKRTGEMPAVPPEEAERIVCWQPGQESEPTEDNPGQA